MKNNYILITMDEVRPDHLGCYGSNVKTPNLDRIAQEGVVFENVISSSCLTPIAHGSILTGFFPYHHGVRSPFDRLEVKSIAQYMKKAGYSTAGFVGVNFLGSSRGFNQGFDYYYEPSTDTAWRATKYKDGRFEYLDVNQADSKTALWGNNWTNRMIKRLKSYAKNPFFVWGHYFECHEGAEANFLRDGTLRKGELSEFCYYDAKIQLMDSLLFGQLLNTIEDLGLRENTYLVITSDHGTNLGEHPIPQKKRADKLQYPQHVTLYDHDIKVPLIISGPEIPSGVGLDDMVRLVDIMPTMLDLADMDVPEVDGIGLLPNIYNGESTDLIAYAEELFALRGHGDFQAVRNRRYKLIVDSRNKKEEFYDLYNDPEERKNIIDGAKHAKLIREWREMCEGVKVTPKEKGENSDSKDIEATLRSLGYI